MYDVTDSDSFKRVKSWVKELRQMASKNIVLAIACNKSDLIRGQSLNLQEAERSVFCQVLMYVICHADTL